MIPAGYLAKFVTARPDWLNAPSVEDIYSVSACVSPPFADYYGAWKHNGFGLFDEVDIIRELARAKQIDLSGARFFYYEVHDRQFDEDGRDEAVPVTDLPFPVNITAPQTKTLKGFDVVTFSGGTGPECSPLSCNGLAGAHDVNRHCLLASLDVATALLKQGAFRNSEPGPFRIFAVYSV
jgi:hypothetical protein